MAKLVSRFSQLKLKKILILALGITCTCLIATYTRRISCGIVYKLDGLDIERSSDSNDGKEESSNALMRGLNNKHGYVVALSFSGQQGAGIQALMSLQCWAASFSLPVRILEPIINDTVFVSVPQKMISSSNTSLRFSDIFDLQHFNTVSESIGYVPLGAREDFFASAQRNVIYVHLKQVPRNLPLSERKVQVIWTMNFTREWEQTCYRSNDSVSKYGDELEYLTDTFCVIRIIEATHSFTQHYIFSENDVRETIYGSTEPHDVTLIFSKWRTPWFVANNELDDPLKCRSAGHDSEKEQFLPSLRLTSDAKYYEMRFLNLSNDVAVMLRIEHMIEYVSQHPDEWSIDKCFTEASKLTKEKQRTGRPMVTLDMGKFGSGVWSELALKRGVDVDSLQEKSKTLLNSLLDNEWTFEKWEESFTQATGGIENSGYIAALQRTLASRAKCLILVGGGTFQDLALKDYLRNHPKTDNQCVHFVCTKNKDSLTKAVYRYM